MSQKRALYGNGSGDLVPVKRHKIEFPTKEELKILSSINKKKLDFDFEKICSVSLSKLNTYCCLTCGKYLRGRTERTPAFLHSVNDNHELFVSFSNSKFYLLPDDKEIFMNLDSIANDGNSLRLLKGIKFSINPTYNKQTIKNFPLKCFDSNQGKLYYNGFVGLTKSTSNNIAHINVVIIMLSHISSIRDYFLLIDHNDSNIPELIKKIAIIMKKLWSPHLFKQHVTPDELISYLMINFPTVISRNNSDPRSFLIWLLTTLCKQDKNLKRILMKSCQGKLQDNSSEKIIPFWNLSLTLPKTSTFKDSRNVNELPQIKLGDLIRKKFSSNNDDNNNNNNNKTKFKLLKYKLPKYLFLHIDRFTESNDKFPIKNRNQTIVNFSDGLSFAFHETDEVKYKQIVNIVHNPKSNLYDIEKDDESNWKIQLLNDATSEWVELDNIEATVKNYNLLFLDESYIQVWEKV